MAEADALQFDRVEIDGVDEAERFARAGERLRAARERAGMNRAELSLRTKINERHLEAVETSDFAALPARIYAVGFARSYAGAVGLDAAEIAAEVRQELAEHENPSAVRPAHQMDIEDPAKIPSRRLAWAAGALAVAAIVAGAVFWRSYFVPAVDLPPVRDQVAASDAALVTPELTPAALVSPTAESAAVATGPAPGAPSAPASTAPSARAPTVSAAPAQSLPSPFPERLEPVAEPSPSPATADA